MKTLTLTLVFISFLGSITHAQVNDNFKTKPKITLPSEPQDNPVILENWHLKELPTELEGPLLKVPQITSDENIPLKTEEAHVFKSGMPTLIPEGSFPMKVYEPDSTVNYSMRVKKFE